MSLRSKSAKGDTIVEVLISIAIVGAALTGGYSLASHSLQEGISASERTAALKMAESQVEALKFRHNVYNSQNNLAAWNTTFGTGAPLNWCLDATVLSQSSPNWSPIVNSTSSSFNPENLTATGAGAHYNTGCTDTQNASTAKYFINITTPSTSPSPTYLIVVRWLPAGNGPVSQEQLYYRF